MLTVCAPLATITAAPQFLNCIAQHNDISAFAFYFAGVVILAVISHRFI